MNKGDILSISYTAKVLDTGRVFNTTDMGTAKQAGIYNENTRYGDLPIVVGSDELLKGIDNALLEMKVGEERVLQLKPAEAFGERRTELVRVLPLQEFKKRGMAPFPGLVIDANGLYGRVQSVSGGRVRVDFNPEYAGKIVEYKVKVVKKLEKAEEQLQALAEKYLPMKNAKVETKFANGVAEIKLPANAVADVAELKQALAKQLQAAVQGVKEVRFVESFQRE